MKKDVYDVVVVGAGPAGSTCAMVTQKAGLKTLLLEKTDFSMIKICTGLLTTTDGLTKNEAAIFDKIYPDIPEEVYSSPKIIYPRVFYANKLVFKSKHQHRNFNRSKLDKWLALNSKAELKTNAMLKSYSEENQSLRVDYTYLGETKTINCKYLVGADGGDSFVLKTLFPSKFKQIDKAIVRQYVLQGKINLEENCFYLFLEKKSFFHWVIPKDNVFLIGTGFRVNEDIDNKMEQYLEFLRSNYNLSGEVVAQNQRNINDHWIDCMLGKGHILLTGEAAGMWGRAGDGIWLGAQSGKLCGECIVEGHLTKSSPIKLYEQRVKEQKLRELVTKLHNNAIQIRPFHREVE